MRLGLLVATVFAVLLPGQVAVTANEKPPAQEKAKIELQSGFLNVGLPLQENAKGTFWIRLKAQVDKKGEGSGILELDPNAPVYTELGFPTTGGTLPFVKLDFTLKFVKKQTIRRPESPRIAAPEIEEEWSLFEIQGPKITSRLFLATEEKTSRRWARLLVHGKDGKVQYVVYLDTPPPPEPCHPGCFPAGTSIRVPGGEQPIERLREGDLVTTVAADGTVQPRKVVSVFVTKNRLVEVRTDKGKLITTETQPMALVGGGMRTTGDLKAGDKIYRWDGRERLVATVQSVKSTEREENVFNLVLGDPAFFIANDFLVRSKPPVVEHAPRVGASGELPPARKND